MGEFYEPDAEVQMKQINNVNIKLKDELKSLLGNGNVVNVVAAAFSMYAYEELKEELNKIEEFNFIFTEPTFLKEKASKQKKEFYIPRKNRESSLYGTEFELKLKNEMTLKSVAKECANWIKNKCKFKSNRSKESFQGMITISDLNGENLTSFQPIQDFSTITLGDERGNNAYTSIIEIENNQVENAISKNLLDTFKNQWNNNADLEDVTNEVIENIEQAYSENAPEFIYYLSIYHIFSEFLENVNEDNLPDISTGLKDSKIYNMLYDFQKDAVLAIINKLNTYNGCILADSVGLGKTFTALAVIKYYELKNKSVLVLCPKKLSDNWSMYRAHYKNNPIKDDRLTYSILYHTDVQRESGKTFNDTDLAQFEWDTFDLVVIDESHNFRNGEGSHKSKNETRYEKLMHKVIEGRVNTKVLMLSATPLNNRFTDLKNQLRLAYADKPEILDEKLDTEKGIDDIITQTQKTYTTWCKLDREDRTTDRLQQMITPDFFKLLDAVSIARSRKHIEKYYNIGDVGKFPNRLKPISLSPALTDLTDVPTYSEINDMTLSLNLSIYMPSIYIHESAADKYISFDKGTMTQKGREAGIVKLMSINLLKRLESSVYAFKLTLKRINEYIDETISIIDKFENNNGVSKLQGTELSESDFDFEDQENDFVIGKKVNIDLRDMDYRTWKNDLMSDMYLINNMINQMEKITPDHDLKLIELKNYIENKINNPFNDDNKKVLVFSAFADTASYLYENLKDFFYDKYKVHSAFISGSTEGKTTIKGVANDLNSVLTCFSPVSKNKALIYPNIEDDITLLFGTDCISEGQNLQDCDTVVNYDIHWNPIRIIQRFGRVDRIGSKNKDIQLVNFWPDIALDEYIKLKDRVESRMKAVIMTATGDENPIDLDEVGDLEYRASQLKVLKEKVVDVEDMSESFSITDLGLNEFRLDLLNYIHEHGETILESKPKGLHAVARARDELCPGVIFILKNVNSGINKDNRNHIHPFYMVYVSDNGEIKCDYASHKKLLDDMRLLCKGNVEPIKELCAKFNEETSDGRNMKVVSNLLNKAISSIINTKDESDVDSLFTPGGTTACKSSIKGLEDFELISFLVIRNKDV